MGSATPPVVLTFLVSRHGVEAGERLLIEYLAPSLEEWDLLREVVSNGVDPTAYTVILDALPPAARHDRARIRLRTECDGDADDSWFVDSFSLAEGFSPFAPPPQLLQVLPRSAHVSETGQQMLVFGEQFFPSASVTINGQPLVAPVWISSSLIAGLVPPYNGTSAPDRVDVVVTQAAQSSTLTDAFLYHSSTLAMPDHVVASGQTSFSASANADLDLPIVGFSFGLDFPAAWVQVATTQAGAALPTGTPDFFSVDFSNSGGWVTVGCVLEIPQSVPAVVIPVGAALELLEVQFTVLPAGAGQTISFEITNERGTPPVAVQFGLPTGEAVTPGVVTPGSITNAYLFLRGDCNSDGQGVNVADAIFLLNFLFNAGLPLPCARACDANSDEAVNLADVIWVLNYLFSGGAPPNAPFPICGVPVTPSTLFCDSFVCP
ncbi:MAG: dockerin type I repeat-containing protein [Dehalococcoidia bacterium]